MCMGYRHIIEMYLVWFKSNPSAVISVDGNAFELSNKLEPIIELSI